MNRILVFLTLTCWSGVTLADVASATLDLRQFGYKFAGSTSTFADYTDVTFLSEDLLLISINQRSFGLSERMFADTPDSTMVLFDLNSRRVIRTGKMSVEKRSGSVQAVKGERFAVMNQKGLQFCNTDLHCSVPIVTTQGTMIVSPKGNRVAVGGNGRSQQRVIETDSLKEVLVSDIIVQQVIPGDDAILILKDDAITLERAGIDLPINIAVKCLFPESRFLNSGLLACLGQDNSVAVIDMTGKQIRSYRVDKFWQASILSAASGTRFGIYEHGYTLLNSVINFLDIDHARPENFQRLRVMDTLSGNEVARLEWDPQPHLIKPALSPSGHWIARVRAGNLEVFQET